MIEIKQQVIIRKVNVNRFARTGGYEIKNGKRVTINYYSEVRRSINRKIKSDTELLTIKIIPVVKDEFPLNEYGIKDGKLSDKAIVEALMYLQREFTPIITIPENNSNLTEDDYKEFETFFNCTILRENSESCIISEHKC
jgi:hypothetical protein